MMMNKYTVQQEMLKQFGVLVFLQIVTFTIIVFAIADIRDKNEIIIELIEVDMIEYCQDIAIEEMTSETSI